MKFLFLLLIVLSVGCTREEVDVSTDNEYSEVIDMKFKTLVDMKMHGITLDRNYKKNIDMYSITTYPGFSGPEVITKDFLIKNSIIKIISVKKCSNCLDDSRNFIIEILSSSKYRGSPVKLSFQSGNDSIVLKKDSKIKMNPNFFLQVK